MRNKSFTLSIFLLLLTMILSIVFMFSFHQSYYEKTYHRLNTAEEMEISEDVLFEATEVLLRYIKSEQDNLDFTFNKNGEMVEFFNQREKDHMVDVQALYAKALLVRNFSLGVGIILLGFTLYYKKEKLDVALAFKQVLISFGLIVTVIVVFALVDFDSFWIMFHELIFSNDLWLLDPNTDRLIQMVPLDFFMGLVYRIFIGIFILFSSAYGLMKYFERKHKYD